MKIVIDTWYDKIPMLRMTEIDNGLFKCKFFIDEQHEIRFVASAASVDQFLQRTVSFRRLITAGNNHVFNNNGQTVEYVADDPKNDSWLPDDDAFFEPSVYSLVVYI